MSNGEPSVSINLYKEVYGSGDPILCLHGLGASMFTWQHFIGPFSQSNKLILVDFKGCGKSPKPKDTDYSIQQHADDIYKIILAENLAKVVLVGSSLGGAIALLLAIKLSEEDPGRLSKLVLIDSGGNQKNLPIYLKLLRSILGKPFAYLSPSRLAAKTVLRRGYYDKKKPTKEQVEAYAAPIANPGGRHALLQTAKQCIPQNYDEVLAKLHTITVPTLILWGREDGIIPLSVGEELHHLIPNSTLEIIEQCGHIPQEEKPDETIARVSRFLAS